ncbi:hypothetical protein A4S06_09185 [Erysipelotrichaceae bacterium MTC7]|nr:hypothetical protein A4S06_09185 [Erysipelotrichaceae bacterium MTC7]
MRKVGRTLCCIVCVLLLVGCGSKCLKAEKIDTIEIARTHQEKEQVTKLPQTKYEEMITILDKLTFAETKDTFQSKYQIHISDNQTIHSYYICDQGAIYYHSNTEEKHGYQKVVDKKAAKDIMKFIDQNMQ